MARSLYPKRSPHATIPLNPVWVVCATPPFRDHARAAHLISTGLEFRAAAELAWRETEHDPAPYVLSPAEGALSYWDTAEVPDRAFSDLDDRQLDAVCTLAVSDVGNAAHLWRKPRVVVLASRRVADAVQRALDGRHGAGHLMIEAPLADLDEGARLRWLAEQLEGTWQGCPDELAHLLTAEPDGPQAA